MEIIQKKRSVKHTFTFYDDRFNVAYEEKSGSSDADITYADFPQKSSIQVEQNEWLRNVGLLWIAIGMAQIAYAFYLNAPITGREFWILIGAACVAWAYSSRIKYTVYRAEHGNIFVIQDKLHDKIIDEINSRRKAQLLNWHGEVNAENDLEYEVRKFNWLLEQEVISKEEAEQKIAQASMIINGENCFPGERLN